MGTIHKLEPWKPNSLGYSHVLCGSCEGSKFYMQTSDTDMGKVLFYSLVCVECGNEIFVSLLPVWGDK